MAVTEIIEKIRKNNEQIRLLSAENDKLNSQLEVAEFADWDWIPVKKAADAIGLSVGFIYNRINEGKLQSKRFGSKICVMSSEVKAINDSYCV